MLTYAAPSLPEVFGRTAPHFPRVQFDIEVGFAVNVLDLVDPWFWFSVLEDGRGATGRGQGHGGRGSATTWGTRASDDTGVTHQHTPATPFSRMCTT